MDGRRKSTHALAHLARLRQSICAGFVPAPPTWYQPTHKSLAPTLSNEGVVIGPVPPPLASGSSTVATDILLGSTAAVLRLPVPADPDGLSDTCCTAAEYVPPPPAE